MANYFKLRKIPKAYNDNNLNSQLPLKVSDSLPSDREMSPGRLASPKSPTSINEASPAARFKRLSGILRSKKGY